MTSAVSTAPRIRITRPDPRHSDHLGWVVLLEHEDGGCEVLAEPDTWTTAWRYAESYVTTRARVALATERHALRQRRAVMGIVLLVLLAAVATGVLVWLPR
ncbi:MAG: hypothetical protein AAFZ07_25690 [Actinomycetota bacterium]